RRYVSRARRCSSSDRPSPSWYGVHPALHSFPTRRSSDLLPGQQQIVGAVAGGGEPLDEMLPEGGKAPGLAQVQPAEKGGEKLERQNAEGGQRQRARAGRPAGGGGPGRHGGPEHKAQALCAPQSQQRHEQHHQRSAEMTEDRAHGGPPFSGSAYTPRRKN